MNNSKKYQATLIDEEIISDFPCSLQKYMKEMSKELQDEIGEGGRTLYPQDKIAKCMGISVDQLRNKIYGKKPITRDWIIALCAAYGMDSAKTSEALVICGMPRLDDAASREIFLVNYLDEHLFIPTSIEEINLELMSANLPPIEIEHRNGNNKNQKKLIVESKYRVLYDKVVHTYVDIFDQYDSISTQYLPNYSCVATVGLEDEKCQYTLKAFSDGTFQITSSANTIPTRYLHLNETGSFQPYFLELSSLVKKKKKKLDMISYDSRNFKGRFGANIKRDSIHVFYEEYNYACPELNEYNLMEYNDGHFSLSISDKSMFMQEYLSKEEFYNHYSSTEIGQRKVYFSIEELEKLRNADKHPPYYPDIYSIRKNTFIHLQKLVQKELEAIRNRSVFINHLDYIWDNPYEVLQYYGLERQFECEYDEKHGGIFTNLKSASFYDIDGKRISLSFEDIKLAFELGFTDIEQIIRVKRKKGSISAVLE